MGRWLEYIPSWIIIVLRGDVWRCGIPWVVKHPKVLDALAAGISNQQFLEDQLATSMGKAPFLRKAEKTQKKQHLSAFISWGKQHDFMDETRGNATAAAHLVVVAAQHDANNVFADVVHVALDSCLGA